MYNDNTPYDNATISTIKQYLSRGIAIALGMYVGTSALFENYIGGGQVLYVRCTYDHTGSPNVDHAVTLVGYGKKNNKSVWIIKNSWGDSWGDQGFFFVEIGKDSFCTEHSADAIVPKYYVEADGAFTFEPVVRNESWQLDPDPIVNNNTNTTNNTVEE